MCLFGMDGINSYSMVGSLLAFGAVGGCYALARNVGVGRLLSLALAIAFLSQTFFAVHTKGYGAAGFGFALLPAFCVFFQHLVNQQITCSSAAKSGLLVSIVMIFFAFLDGYSFVMAVASGVAIIAAYLICENANWRRHLSSLGILASATGVAFLLYKEYVPAVGLPGYPSSEFAKYSVHIPSLFWPTTDFSILFDCFGLSERRPATTFVGAGVGNHETVFLSLTALVLAVACGFVALPRVWRTVALLLIVGGSIMAIGPVLPESNGKITESQSVSSERAPLFRMPTYPLYTSVPGLDQMRATYRWIAVVKLGLWMLVCLFCGYLASRYAHGEALAFGLVALMILEVSANPFQQWTVGERQYKMADNLQRDLVLDLTAHVPSRSKLLVLPITNDFVVHSVAAKADIYTYNVAGDKNLLIAQSQRPDAISQVAKAGPCLLNSLSAAAEKGEIDFLAFRMFDSHRGLRGWIWPPTTAEVDENQSVAMELSRHLPESLIVKGKYFWFVDARHLDQPMLKEACDAD